LRRAEFERLKRSLPHIKLGLLHGKLSARLKNQVLSAFRRGEIDVLVSTPVVEVGIDIPNATIMVVEAAERFGLAQLHQLRGRVGRGEKKSYCLLFTESEKDKTQARLAALKENISGFELAEIDLKMRGPGELFGTLQSGFPELKIANWMDIELIKSTRECAEELLENTQKYPSLIEYLDKKIIAKN
jgi:ATP-dependent DNA helicase RecG